MCGENPRRCVKHSSAAGSPPRVRGKPSSANRCRESAAQAAGSRSFRITPACAGKTFSYVDLRGCREDHPRVCGENSRPSSPSLRPIGSPPRVRGKQWLKATAGAPLGITPACAGKTEDAENLFYDYWDHPRVCGENHFPNDIIGLTKGSPPRVRGKPFLTVSKQRPHRITPACAGKTLRDCRQLDAR